MRYSILYIIGFLFVSMLFSCSKDKRPDYVLAPGEMEDALYDYHLAQAMGNSHSGNTSAYMDAFYKKHNITQDQLDSSFNWYAHHMTDLKHIYENLDKRFTEASEKLGFSGKRNSDNAMQFSENGDTTEIWNGHRMIYLASSEMVNNYTFSIDADTSFHQHDNFRLQMGVHLLKNPKSDYSTNFTVGMVIIYENDSVSSQVRTCAGNMQMIMQQRADSALNIKKVTGFIVMNSKKNDPVILDNISMYKIHTENHTSGNTNSSKSSQEPDDFIPASSGPAILKVEEPSSSNSVNNKAEEIALPEKVSKRLNPDSMRIVRQKRIEERKHQSPRPAILQ